MTNREFLVCVKNVILGAESEILVTDDELVAKADELIASLDRKNELRKSSESKEKKETAERVAKVAEFFKDTTDFFSRDDVANATGLTVGQVGSALSKLVKGEYLIKTEIKDGKSRKMKYKLSQTD